MTSDYNSNFSTFLNFIGEGIFLLYYLSLFDIFILINDRG